MLDLDLKLKEEKQKIEDNEMYYVMETKIYYDEVYHFVVDTFYDFEEALEFAKKTIVELTDENYYRLEKGFYNSSCEAVYVLTVCSLSNKKGISNKLM